MAVKTLKMRCTEWRDWSADLYLTTRARLQHQVLHLRNRADQQWEAVVAEVTKAFTDAQNTTTAAINSLFEAVATFAARVTSLSSSSAALASSWLQAWGPSILRALVLALAVLATWKVYVATDGAIVAWAIKTIRFLAPRVVAWLHWLLMWKVYVMLCVAEGVLDFIVAHSVLVLAGSVVPVSMFILCTFITLAFPRYVKPNHEDEVKKEMGAAAQAGGIFSPRWMEELQPLPGILLALAFYSTARPGVCTFDTANCPGLAVVKRDETEQEANHQKPPQDTTTTAEATTTAAMAIETQKHSLFARVHHRLNFKNTIAMPRRPRLTLQNHFTRRASMQPRPRVSSAAIHERPTPTASDATLEIERVRSESGFVVWARRAARGVSMSMGVRRVSQDAVKEGKVAMVAAGC